MSSMNSSTYRIKCRFRIAESKGKCICNFDKYCKVAFRRECAILNSHQEYMKVVYFFKRIK